MDGSNADDDYFVCPHCGATVHVNATFCSECGSDDQTGWSEDAGSSPFDLGTDFDYDEFIEREFSDATPVTTRDSAKRIAVSLIVVLTCICLLLLFF